MVDYSNVKMPTNCSKLTSMYHDITITTALNSSISNGNISIIDYFLDRMIKDDFKIDISSIISFAAKQKSSYIFNYLLEKIKQLNLFKFDDFDWSIPLKKGLFI